MIKISQDEAIRAISAIAYTLVKAGLKDTKEVVEKSQAIYAEWCEIKGVEIKQKPKIVSCPRCNVKFEPQERISILEYPVCGNKFDQRC